MFIYKTQIRLHDTDAAGILFFANQFSIIHDAYELLLEEFDFSFLWMVLEGIVLNRFSPTHIVDTDDIRLDGAKRQEATERHEHKNDEALCQE